MHPIVVPISRLPSTTPLKPGGHRALTKKEKQRADEQFLMSEWATRLPLPSPSNPRTSPVTECHLEPFFGQRRITDYWASTSFPVTDPVDQSDSDSDATVPWDSECEPPNGYMWTAIFLADLRTSGFEETVHWPLVQCPKEETDSDEVFVR